MVSGEKVWDPLHAGLVQPRLNEQRPAARITPLCVFTQSASKDATWPPSRRPSPLSSPPLPPAASDTARPRPTCGPGKARAPHKAARSLGARSRAAADDDEDEEEGEGDAGQLEMKGKRHGGRGGEAVMEERLEDVADGPKNAKITLSFPLSAGPLPASLTSPGHCRGSASSSPSPHRRRPSSKSSDEGSLWKLDSTMDVKHRPFKPPRRDGSPSSSPSSSSSPMTVHALLRKDIKSPPPLKCSKLTPETPFHKSPPRCPGGSFAGPYGGGGGGGDGWDERQRLGNGTASPSQTAQILFSLGASAFQRGLDVERKEKMTGRPAGKLGSPHGPSLHPPTLHLPPPLPPPPPPPSEGLTAPPHSSSYPPTDGLKPELICGVCHRLFSSASSLTVHMRLHRGSRALSCRFCGKVFIHSKRLQSHEASCRVPGLPPSSGGGGGGGGGLGPPALAVQPKEEPLEEGEVRVEGGVIVGGTDIGKARPGKKARSLLARIQGDDAAAAELLGSDESHFVKVVDGTVIYFCSVCERSYMTLSSLKRHSNVHSWRRKYPCHYCDKVFALAEYRTKHEVWHTGERRYQCIFCWDAFATYYNLKTHQKTIHGINPSLISSEKTANGGYKQKANALKLYRLLPMRSQKRPYKTYSDSLHNGLLIPPSEAPSLPLPGLGCALGPGDLQSLISGAHAQSVKPDPDAFPDGFPVSVPAEHRDLAALAPLPPTDMPHVRKHDGETQELEQGRGGGGGGGGGGSKMCSSSKTKTPKAGRGGDAGMPSVITYGHTKPSVIVHGTAVSSSVIVHSNQLASGREGSPLSSPSPDGGGAGQPHKGSPKSAKKQRDGAENHRKRSRDSSDATDDGSRGRQDGSLHKSHRSHSKGDTASSKAPPGATPAPPPLPPAPGSQAKEAGPLCQITVRIGEEAIVKRSISETDLRRDKSHSPPKTKRGDASSARETKEVRHSHHHHHHHKHRIHHRAGLDDEDKGEDCEEEEEEEDCEEEEEGQGEEGKKSLRSRSEVREYYFRQREQDSDHDTEDNLWRPYYSYKPKRKAQAHLQRVKSWQRKLKFKRSIRLKRRAERLKNHAGKGAERSPDEEEEEEEGEEDGKAGEDESPPEAGKDAGGEKAPAPPKDKSKEAEQPAKEAGRDAPAPPLHSPQPPLSTSAAPAGIKRRPWTNGNAAECGTCGRWFSSPRKRDKHELSHLLEFVCLFCRATFPSRDKLEDHQRAQHPKPSGEQHEGAAAVPPEAAKYGEEKGSQVALVASTSCPTRLSRRALSRHTCPQCHKVCKTSSALTRHVRRHELSSSPEREKDDKDSEGRAAEAAAGRNPEAEKVPSALSVPVISYSTPDPPGSDNSAPPPPPQDDRRMPDPHEKAAEVARPASEREPSPKLAEPPPEGAANPAPPKPEPTPATPPAPQSVLVMSGSECLDYRTPSRKSLDGGQIHRIPSPAHTKAAASTSPNAPMTSQTRITTATPPVSMATAHSTDGGFMKRDGVIMDRERKGGSGVFIHAGYEEPPRVQDLRIQPLSRSPSPSPDQAQDLTMSSIRAREREVERREKEKELERQRDREKEKLMSRVAHAAAAAAEEQQVALLVPKEEPLSPAPSPPPPLPAQTTINAPPSHRHTPKSPCHSATAAAAAAAGLLSQAKHHVHSGSQGLERLPLPTGAAGAGERPSAHALLLPRAPPAPPPEPERRDSVPSRDSQQGEGPPMGYPAQDYPLPLIAPDGYHSGKKQEENLFMSSYPAGALPFGPLGKVMVPNGGDLAKLPFYPDPYQLLYGSQLLAYPYNLAALPVALNMMAPGGDKVEPLPFLPAIFNYAAAAAAASGPYVGAAPHPLVANPGLYSGGGGGGNGGGKKQRDSSSNKP